MRRMIFPFLLLLLIPHVSRCTEVPFLSGRVNDVAGILSPSTVEHLETILKAQEDSTSNQVVVLTIKSLEGEDLEGYSMKVVETWKLGQAKNDNGVLLLIVKDDRKVRIEVGVGLEGNLTDATSGRIIRHEIVPHFKEGDYDAGVQAGVNAILAAINGAYVADDDSQGGDDLGGRLVAFLLFLGVVGLFSVIAALSSGFGSWVLFLFLIPFWLFFPASLLGAGVGIPLFVFYIIGFIVSKIWLKNSVRGKLLSSKWSAGRGFGALAAGGWSSRGGSFSSGGGGFSGGGGSFGGGGASGSW